MNSNRIAMRGLWASCLCSVLLVTTAAQADGVLVRTQQIPAASRTALAVRIQAAHKQHPEWFNGVRQVRARAAELDAHKRGRLAPLSPLFKALGRNALLPMVEMMAFEATPRGDLNDTAWRALQGGLLEAVGDLRDPSVRSVLVAVLDGPETDEVVVRAAASALGKLADTSDADKLIALARTPGAKHKAVLAGMGDCRRSAVATALGDMLAAHPDEPTARVIVRSLGSVGSAWAWKTPDVATHADEQAAVRATAARALVSAFSGYEGDVRTAASNALMMVDDPSTPSLIATARQGASAPLAAELDRLAERFARNPTR
ncbi:MAG: hypothetical protein HY898_11310 [Deltaproteobacteria bacterium]|nr:hypothetical protein [Deltaproteobacteria bacterium]